jgi:hypothetical protein
MRNRFAAAACTRPMGHRRVNANSNERIGDVLFTSISVVFL